jgi:hypothetical protein
LSDSDNSGTVNWAFGSFETILANHKDSLKTIRLGRLGPTYEGTFDISGFTKLETLQVSAYSISPSAELAASTLLDTNLQTLVLDYTITRDERTEGFENFQEEQALWVLTFAEIALAKSSSLVNIKIQFNPDVLAFRNNWRITDVQYPWDMMDEVSDAIGPLGICLSYNKPNMSKEDFMKVRAQYH